MDTRHSYRTIGRLSMYRRVLLDFIEEGRTQVYSHQLALAAGVTAAQVRRDLMAVEPTGTPNSGYNVRELIASIAELLDAPRGEKVALVGLGNLGRAVLAYMAGRRPNMAIVAAFDNNPQKVNRVIHGCRCHPIEELPALVEQLDIRVGIITVPAPAAQHAAYSLVAAGVTGLVNFAPVPLHVPAGVYVENLDVTMTLEKVAFFARQTPLLRNVSK